MSNLILVSYVTWDVGWYGKILFKAHEDLNHQNEGTEGKDEAVLELFYSCQNPYFCFHHYEMRPMLVTVTTQLTPCGSGGKMGKSIGRPLLQDMVTLKPWTVTCDVNNIVGIGHGGPYSWFLEDSMLISKIPGGEKTLVTGQLALEKTNFFE